MEMQSANLDDLIPEEEREIILDLETALARKEITKCPYLAKEESFFYYCGANIEEVIAKGLDLKLHIFLRKYRNIEVLKDDCMRNFLLCPLYKMEQELLSQQFIS